MASTQKDTVKLVNSLFEFAQAGMKQRREQWEANYKYWSATNTIRRPKFKDNVRVPLIFMITDDFQAALTDNRPKVKFLPHKMEDVNTAESLNEIFVNYYWDELEFDTISEELIWWAANISGSSFLRWGISREKDGLYVEVLNPFCCFPDPGGKRLESLEFFDYISVWSLGDLKRVYPQAKNIKANNRLMNYVNPKDVHSPWQQGRITNNDILPVFKDPKFKKDFGRVMVHEMWLKDDTMVPIPFEITETDDEHREILSILARAANGEIPPELLKPPEIGYGIAENHPAHLKAHADAAAYWQTSGDVPEKALQLLLDHMRMHGDESQHTKKLKYPNGKNIVVCEDELLEETAAPFGLPLSKMDFISDFTDLWGKTGQEYIQSLQDNKERRKRQVSDASDKAANPTRFYDVNAQWEPNNSKGNAGEQIPVDGNPNMVIYTEPSPQVPAYVLQDGADSERLAEKILGLPEAAQGIEPAGDLSGKAIQLLQEAPGKRMRKAARHFEKAVVGAFRGILKFMRFEDPTKVFPLLANDPQERYKYIELSKLNIESEYSIKITAGSTLPTSRMQKLEQALQLATTQVTPDSVYDRQAVLEYIDDPKALEVAERTNKEQQYVEIIEQLNQQNEQLQEFAEDATKENEKLLKENERLKIRESVKAEARRAKAPAKS
jgi:hypothetical protein